MSRPFAFVLIACCLVAVSARAQTHAWRVAGAWQGEVRPDARLPTLPWRVEVDAVLGGATSLTFVAVTPAGEVTAQVERASGDDPFAWRVDPHALDVRATRAWLAPLLGGLEGFELDGTVTMQGQGTWNDAGASGAVRLTWQSEQWRWAENDLAVNQAQLTAEVTVTDSVLSRMEVAVNWSSAVFAGVSLGEGELRASRAGERPWQVETLRVAAWRGQVALAPFTLDPAAPQVDTTVSVDEVSISDLVAFFPQALRAADGRLTGKFTVRWALKNGLRPGQGALRVLNTEVARVQLAASPGLLSGRVPARIAVLPGWLGPLARWTAVENPAFKELEEIELGDHFLNVKSLEVELNPGGDGQGVSARVRLVARPEGTKIVDEVAFTVNVTGPLQELIELGLDKRSRIGLGKN